MRNKKPKDNINQENKTVKSRLQLLKNYWTPIIRIMEL